MAGQVSQVGMYRNPPLTPVASPLERQYGLYEGSVKQQTGDYNNIMQLLQNLVSQSQDPNGRSGYTPEIPKYTQSKDYRSAFDNLSGLSKDGGYSESGIQDLRQRGISPIRSVYAGANRDIDRNRSLQGGYSPSYNATQAKMAREMSGLMSDKMGDVNAGIAQNVAQNRLAASSPLMSAAGNENALRFSAEQAGADAVNRSREFQRSNALQSQLSAIDAMRGLYGTTPALASTFGNQALNSAQLQNQITQQNDAKNLQLLNTMNNGIPPRQAPGSFNVGSPLRKTYTGR